MKKVLQLPQAAQDTIRSFQQLQINDHNIVCPYFMNTKKQRSGLRVLVGKGNANEISREVQVWAQLKGFDLAKADEKQIREFMIVNNIGIDCSGFVVHVLNSWLKSLGKASIKHYLRFPDNSFVAKLRRFLRSVENIGANTLTNKANCERIIDLNQIRPGDLIRSKGRLKNAHHVGIVSKVVFEDDTIKEFEYTHSTDRYEEENGIRVGRVVIEDPNAELKDQDWLEIKDGKNWTYEGLLKEYEDNGIRRLKRAPLY